MGTGQSAKICGALMNTSSGVTCLWNHFKGKHKDAYVELKGYLKGESDGGVSIVDKMQKTTAASHPVLCGAQE